MTNTRALERTVEKSRKNVGGLLDDLQLQVSPGTMIDKVMGFSPEGGSDVAETITEQVRKHPLPYLLIAAGIGWLMFSEAREKTDEPKRKQGSRRKSSVRAKHAATG